MRIMVSSLHIVSADPSSSGGLLTLFPCSSVALLPAFPPHPFLPLLFQRHYHGCWRDRPWPVAGLSWSWLALTLSDTRRLLVVSHRSHAWTPPYQNIATQTQYSIWNLLVSMFAQEKWVWHPLAQSEFQLVGLAVVTSNLGNYNLELNLMLLNTVFCQANSMLPYPPKLY